MAPRHPLDAELIVSYLTLRKAIGYIGLLMPIIVRVGAYYFEQIRRTLQSVLITTPV